MRCELPYNDLPGLIGEHGPPADLGRRRFEQVDACGVGHDDGPAVVPTYRCKHRNLMAGIEQVNSAAVFVRLGAVDAPAVGVPQRHFTATGPCECGKDVLALVVPEREVAAVFVRPEPQHVLAARPPQIELTTRFSGAGDEYDAPLVIDDLESFSLDDLRRRLIS